VPSATTRRVTGGLWEVDKAQLIDRKHQVQDRLTGLEMELAIQVSRLEAIQDMVALLRGTIMGKRGELADINSQLNL
jgi:uncharacterized coiled-coil protein SlyX